MSSDCCEINYEGRYDEESSYDEIPVGKDTKKWFRYVDWVRRWFGLVEKKPSTEPVALIMLKEKDDKPTTRAEMPKEESYDPLWGWSAVFDALGGRAWYNIGVERVYTKWPVSFDEQLYEYEKSCRKGYGRPFKVTEILPFDGNPIIIL